MIGASDEGEASAMDGGATMKDATMKLGSTKKGGSPKKKPAQANDPLDVLVFDLAIQVFTRPHIGFLPRFIKYTSVTISNSFPAMCLFNGGRSVAVLQHQQEAEDPNKR